MSSLRIVISLLLLALPLGAQGKQDERSGVRPNVISLPDGPGSIAGLGEQFSPNLATGSVRYAVPLLVPAGTAGVQPELALHYDSGQGNGPLGIGWTLDVGSIQRQTDRGVPRYGADDRFLFDGQELVPLGGGVYRLKNESTPLRFRHSGPHWEVDLPSGTTLRFGVSAGARLDGPLGTYRWALEASIDVWGNRTYYEYERDLGQLYLRRIFYNARPGAAENAIQFDYETRSDALTSFRAGFGITTGKRLVSIRMMVQGQQLRRYQLAYDEGELSRLRSVTMFGTDDVLAAPTLSFTYSGFNPGADRLVELTGAPSFGLADPDAELIDFDGDSLPDLVQVRTGSHRVAYNRGGHFDEAVALPSSPSVALSSPGVQFADLNGDGIADLVTKLSSGPNDFYVHPNHGRGGWEPRVAFTGAPNVDFQAPNVRLIDFDGDGLTDVMQTTSAQFYYWRNRGDGGWDGAVVGPTIPDEAIGFEDSQVRLADFNGDGLVDLARVRDGSLRYWPNMGHGRWGGPVELHGAPRVGADFGRIQLADLNGDGLTDLFLARGTQLEVWLQLGDDSFANTLVVHGMPEAHPTRVAVRAADMDGSGTVDVVWNEGGGATRWHYLDLVGGVRPNLLTSVSNGLGRTETFTYTSSGALYQEALDDGQPWEVRLPVAVQVLSEVVTDDGRGWEGRITFSHRDGFFHGPSRQFRGFGETTRFDVGGPHDAGAVTIHRFDVGREHEVLKGAPLASEVRTEDGVVLRRESWGYGVRRRAEGLDERDVSAKELQWHETELVEGTDTPIVLREEWEWDAFGYVLVHSDWGVIEGENLRAESDERVTRTEYLHDAERWLLGHKSIERLLDGEGNQAAATRWYYDGEAFAGLPHRQLGTRGVVTRTESWVEAEHWVQSERLAYDDFGLVVATLSPIGGRRDIAYDTETHRFPVAESLSVSDALTLSLTAQYDLLTGQLLSYRDAAGRERRFTYDALLRLTSIIEPGDSLELPTASFDYEPGNPLSRSITRLRPDAGKPEVQEAHSWFDGLGRALATIRPARGGGTVTSDVVVRGPRGNVIREFDAFASNSFELSGRPEGVLYVQTSFDALGRAVRTRLQDGTETQSRHRPALAEHWNADDLNEASPHHGTPRLERSNGLGIIEVIEELPSRKLSTHFHRNVLGEIQRTEDALGNVATWQRDGLGRLTTRNHYAAGTALFRYDDAGNILESTDARGAKVVSEYDVLGRLLSEQHLAADGTEEHRVRYHHDVASPEFPDAPYALGSLNWVEDAGGEVHLRFDARGRLIDSIRKLDEGSWRTQRAYDGLDRLQRLTYPSGRFVTFEYDEAGQMASIPGVLDDVRYDARGLETQRSYANGVLTVQSRDALKRLESLRTTGNDGERLLDLGVLYSPSSDVLQVVDRLTPSGPDSASRTYAYDALSRLLSAKSPTTSWSYTFDDIGNLVSKSDVGAYVDAPEARTSEIGGERFTFDAAGNLLTRPGVQYGFNAAGLIASVQSATAARRWVYDASGQVLLEEQQTSSRQSRVAHVDPWVELRDGVLHEYVLVGSERIALLELSGEGGAPGCAAASGRSASFAWLALLLLLCALRGNSGRPSFAPVLALSTIVLLSCSGAAHGPQIERFFHADQLGSSALETGPNGDLLRRTQYAPYGAQIGATNEDYSFTGKKFDAETGLYHFGARAYEPWAARFISPDPATLLDPGLGLSDPQVLNPYAYSRNNPATYTDPDGQFPFVESRIIKHAATIHDMAAKHKVDPMAVASIIYQEKMWTIIADAANIIPNYSAVTEIPYWPKKNPNEGTFGMAEMKPTRAAELLNLDLNVPKERDQVIRALLDDEKSIELIAMNIADYQRRLNQTMDIKSATVAHNAGWAGLQSHLNGEITQATVSKAVYGRSWGSQESIREALYSGVNTPMTRAQQYILPLRR